MSKLKWISTSLDLLFGGLSFNHFETAPFYVRFILAFAGVLIFAGCLFLPTWIWSVCTEEMITMLPVVITMVIEIVLSLCFVRLSRRGSEQKYELY